MTKGIGLIVCGTEGVGKTSFAAEFPKPITCFSCPGDTGMEDLIDLGEVNKQFVTNINCESYGDVSIGITRCDSKTIIIDSLLGYQHLLFQQVCDDKYEGNFERFYDYFKGPRQEAPRYAQEFCTKLENLRRQGKHIIVIGHVKDETVHNPRGLDYRRTDLDIDEGIKSVFKKWGANILFMTTDPSIERVTKKVSGTASEAKMKDEDLRVIYTRNSLVHTAKNKLNLPIVISMGQSSEDAYENFVERLPPLYKEQLEP